MQKFVQLRSKKWVYQLDRRWCIYQLIRQKKKGALNQLFKDKNI
jgi:hypothetical protein